LIFDEAIEKILMTQRSDNIRWCLPGGGMDPGESASETCIREVMEETGLEVRVIRLIVSMSGANRLFASARRNSNSKSENTRKPRTKTWAFTSWAKSTSAHNGSALSDWVKEKSVAVFRRVAEAEGKVHGMPPDEVHFHEVGAVDSIVDIVGGCIALELLDKPRVLAAPVTEGTGWVECAHGRFPVPTAATLEILGARGVVVNQCDEPHELVTPTGAALLAEFAESFGLMRGVTPERIGYGLGTRDMLTRPNVLRAVLGQAATATEAKPLDWERDTVTVIETNLDDINAEHLGHFVETVLEAGALDVFHTPIQMKKNRPGVMLTVLCAEADADRFSEMILRETTALGVRRHAADRRKLRREVATVDTRLGQVRVKLGRLNGELVQAAPEYESCRDVAAKAGVPLKAVYAAAQKALEN
jgi:uncharacterized protein (TIGR00299 family) protein